MQPTPATAASPPADEGGLTSSEARLQRNLKIIVVAMGVLIFAGLATIAGRIIYLASSSTTQPATAATTPHAAVSEPSTIQSQQQTLELPAGAVVRSVSLSGDRLAVHYEAAGSEGIAVLDLVSGRKLTSVEVRRSGSPGE